ncbi:zinc-dependent peptidase [Undibacterium sp. Rencai35W]|uniref:M90 family metallopeptidase n=1 Tax=Undibacterium sp. Rencai35W TaxID=3413046 RepID=UPI003BF31AAE
MNALPLILFLALLAIAILAAVYLPAYLLKRAIQQPFPSHYAKILRKNIPVYSRMPADIQLQLKRLIKQFLYQKKFIACDGLQMSDEIKVTIAGRACMLLLNRTTAVYPALKTVLVYPSPFVVPRLETGIGGVVTHAHQSLSGESWSDGRVIVAWDHVQRRGGEQAEGHDVVLHEFAHQLDSETGVTNGAPALGSKAKYQRWSRILSEEFAALQQVLALGEDTVIDPYGATNPAEFFAVVTETFFEKPWAMARRHTALFEQFRAYYQVDPRDWS